MIIIIIIISSSSSSSSNSSSNSSSSIVYVETSHKTPKYQTKNVGLTPPACFNYISTPK